MIWIVISFGMMFVGGWWAKAAETGQPLAHAEGRSSPAGFSTDAKSDKKLRGDHRAGGRAGKSPVVAGGSTSFPGDCVSNGVIDSGDLNRFFGCLSGPEPSSFPSGCRCADMTNDNDADLEDIARLLEAFGKRDPALVCGASVDACLSTHAQPGCSDATCCGAICQADGFCCKERWDNVCVDSASIRCPQSPGVPPNDRCRNPQEIHDGTTAFSTAAAMDDGPNDGGACSAIDIGADVWFCYTATCTGDLIASLCGSGFDTTMSVYNDCGCPTGAAVGCSDDDCGGTLNSRVTLPVSAGQVLTIRVGGFVQTGKSPAQGTGIITMICGDDPFNTQVCGAGQGSCFSDHRNPGCDNRECCLNICDLDPFCCDVQWDDFCGDVGVGLCGDGFDSCGEPNPNPCNNLSNDPGCASERCCDAVCQTDPYCCIIEWDDACVDSAAALGVCR